MEAKGETKELRLYMYSNLPLLCGKKQREMKEMAGSYQSRYEDILTVFSPVISNAKAAQDQVQTRRTRTYSQCRVLEMSSQVGHIR